MFESTKELGGASEMMLYTIIIVQNELTNIESSSQKVVDELKVSCKESMVED
jgi:hypothetical protein